MAVMTLGLSCSYMLLLDTTGAHPVTWIVPSWVAIAIGLLGQCGVLHEEVLARGYILMVVERRAGAGRAILISALCFVLLHIPVRGISSMAVSWLLGGLLYGYLYVKSGSLLVTLAAHVLHNIAGDLFLYSDNGVSVLHFATPLSGTEKIGFKLILTLLLLGLASLIYGRGMSFLEPSRRLSERWARMTDRQDLKA
jgi:membrane protease YdiL (CAAX protease family)